MKTRTRLLPTKYSTQLKAQKIADLYRLAGIPAFVVPGKSYPIYRVRIYPADREPVEVSK